MVLVEKLCMVCERRYIALRTFRLLRTRQWATIPRCLVKTGTSVGKKSQGTAGSEGANLGRSSGQETEDLRKS